MTKYYLAIDIGASSGRHILSHLEDGKMILEEVHRFSNGMKKKNGALCWDYEEIFSQILAGMKRCKDLGKIPVSVGVDTWGVDFVLLDQDDNVIGDTVGYRDSRTAGMDEEVYKIIPEDELYARTGIQKAIYNSIYQLMAIKTAHPEQLRAAKTFLMVPDYFHWKLSGVKSNEYSEATTSQLIDPKTRQWDKELIEKLGFPTEMFQNVSMPGTDIGELSPAVQAEVGYNCHIVLPATHDTQSAVLAVPSQDPDTVFLSSGTWSLMGVERDEADCSPESKAHNFANEGGYAGKICYLKNIMGLWMIQSVKKELEQEGISLSFAQLCAAAAEESIDSVVDCNADRFLAPASMTDEVRNACKESGQTVPETPAQLAAVIYRSLAKCYADTITELQIITGKTYKAISIVGGGSSAEFLNELTAKYTGRTVYAGPGEATAIGNMVAQMLTSGELQSPSQAKECIFASFGVKTYTQSEE